MTNVSQVTVRRTISVGTASIVSVVLPVMLLGALAVLMRDEFELDAGQLGFAVASYYFVSAVASVVGGRIADVSGSTGKVRLALVLSALSNAALGFAVRSWQQVALALVVAGVANGLAQGGVNRALFTEVPRTIQGTVFGLKQSAVPAASFLAGLSIPVLVSAVGWRWVFGSAALVITALIFSVPKWEHVRSERQPTTRGVMSRGLIVAIIGSALPAASCNAMAAFMVSSLVDGGVTAGTAGTILAVAAFCGIGGRILAGALADRMRQGHFALIVVLVLGGAAAYLLLAWAPSQTMLLVGAILGYGVGWAWPGVMLLAVGRATPGAPATFAGVTQATTFVGAVAGPAAFGQVALHVSYPAAWTMLAIASALGAVTMYLGGRRVLHPTEV